MECPPEIETTRFVRLPRPEEDQDKEETVFGRTDCLDFVGGGGLDDWRSCAAPWDARAVYLAVEAAVWAHAGDKCVEVRATGLWGMPELRRSWLNWTSRWK